MEYQSYTTVLHFVTALSAGFRTYVNPVAIARTVPYRSPLRDDLTELLRLFVSGGVERLWLEQVFGQ
jgi:hypothetical protein